MIFFAVENDIVLAVCMTKPIGEDTWESCKLATDERCREEVQEAGCLRSVWNMRWKTIAEIKLGRLWVRQRRYCV